MSEQLRTVKLYDSRTGKKRHLEPAEPGKIKMYVCGVTVYDLTHIGHARVFIFFDVVQRLFRHLGYDVEYIRNHTDVDDKILKRAEEEGIDPLELSEHYIQELDRDMGELDIESPDAEPKVSEHIDDIIEFNEQLLERGHAYEADGDVYYRVESFDEYGKLSGRNLDDLEAGRSGRVEDDDETKKENPFDFALWKKSEDDELGWDSPWGYGRPGWHIECSVMSTAYLGETFDIHGGGSDLIFPHHENEIAQAEAATGESPFADFWMHVGMVNVAEETEEGEEVVRKMSKSLGNFWTTRDVLGGYHPDAIRYFMHTTLYRKPITYAIDNLEAATRRVSYLYDTIRRIDKTLDDAGYDLDANAPEGPRNADGYDELVEEFEDRYEAALTNDFNTPKALALIGELATAANEAIPSGDPSQALAYTLYRLRNHLTQAGSILGILTRDPDEAVLELRELRLEAMDLDADAIEQKIEARKQARQDQDWEKADALRDELEEIGVELMDSSEGTTWRLK